MSLEVLASATAMVVSLVSLYIAVRQTQVQERQLEASVWPSLIYDTGNGGDDGKQTITFGLKNGGVGPARVRSLEVSYKGEALKDFKELLRACSPAGENKVGSVKVSDIRGRLLTPGQEIDFLEVGSRDAADPWADPFWKHLDDVRFEVDGRVCYCSALEQCWTLGFQEREPTPVKDCAEAAKRVQYGR